ncbi:MAG: hypothetical protein AAGU74_08360 [Bacillota bacterium]
MNTEQAIVFFENALDNCVMVAREPFGLALAALRGQADLEQLSQERETARYLALRILAGGLVPVNSYSAPMFRTLLSEPDIRDLRLLAHTASKEVEQG